jgi:glycosyltransferase involved in cell wall biosynthesis
MTQSPTQRLRHHSVYWVNQFAVAPDQPGGTRHYEMARGLNANGHSCALIASDFNLNLRRYLRRGSASDRAIIQEVAADVPFVWLPAGRYERNDWRRALSMLIFAWHILHYLVFASKPPGTVLVGSTPHLPGAAATWLAARLRRIPFVLEVRDLWPESMVGVDDSMAAPVVAMLRILSDFLYRRADAIVVLAQPNIERLVDRGADRDRIFYIPNGVDASTFEPTATACSIDLPEDKRTFVYTGAHGPANGLNIALHAARELMDRGEERAHLLFVGDGPAKDELVALAEGLELDNVTFADPIPKAEIPTLLHQAHAGLMLLADVEVFRYGVSPNKLFDYLATGLPVITNVPGEVARIVDEADGGVLVPPSDPVALADAIQDFAACEPWRTDAPAYIREHHDRRKLAKDLVEVIEFVRS